MFWSVVLAPDCVGMGRNVFSIAMFVMERETVGMDQMKKDVVSFHAMVAFTKINVKFFCREAQFAVADNNNCNLTMILNVLKCNFSNWLTDSGCNISRYWRHCSYHPRRKSPFKWISFTRRTLYSASHQTILHQPFSSVSRFFFMPQPNTALWWKERLPWWIWWELHKKMPL